MKKKFQDTFGTNPKDPWSAKAGLAEGNDHGLIARFLKSKGIDPRYINHEKRAAHGRSGEFQKWKAHILAQPPRFISSTNEEFETLSAVKKILKTVNKNVKPILPGSVVKEDTYDVEKDDKNPQKVKGTAPNLEKAENQLKRGETPNARAVLSGGKTETGQPRDIIEIDPALRNRPMPGTADLTKNNKKPS